MKVNIEAERIRNRMTKQSLCKELGITTRTYANYILEITAIPSNILEAMAKLFHCSIDHLLGLDL